MVRIALAGLGFMGRTHLGAYSRLANVQVVAVCSTSPRNSDVVPPDARIFNRFHEMIFSGGFDAVDICLPTKLHPETTIEALQAGYPVLCEKPLALTAEESGRIVKAANESAGSLAVAHCLRHWPAYVAAKSLVDSGEYGKVLHAELSRLSPMPDWSSKSWILDPLESGGAALDFHIHDSDMLMYLFGAPSSVYSQGLSSVDRGVYHLTTLYSYPDFTAVATGGWTASASYGFKMSARLLLEGATIEVQPEQQPGVRVFPNDAPPYSVEDAVGDGYLPLLSAFVTAVERHDFAGLVTANEAAQSVALCLSEVRSVLESREVHLSF